MRTVVLVAQDASPSRSFQLLAPALEERGWTVHLFVAGGEPFASSPSEMVGRIAQAHVVLLGMASSAELAAPEIAAGEAARTLHIPYGFFGDTKNCWGRASKGRWFASLAPDASFYCGVSRKDAEEARQVFPKARVYGTGSPLREQSMISLPSRQEIRAQLKLDPEDFLILSPGMKFPAGNIVMWGMAMEAVGRLLDPSIGLVLAPHPGDRTLTAIDRATGKELAIYHEMTSFAWGPSPVTMIDPGAKASHLVAGADMVIEFGGSIGLQAFHLGIPVVTPQLGILLKRLASIQGDLSLEIVEEGWGRCVDNASHLMQIIGDLKRNRREPEPIPFPKQGALGLIAEALQETSR